MLKLLILHAKNFLEILVEYKNKDYNNGAVHDIRTDTSSIRSFYKNMQDRDV